MEHAVLHEKWLGIVIYAKDGSFNTFALYSYHKYFILAPWYVPNYCKIVQTHILTNFYLIPNRGRWKQFTYYLFWTILFFQIFRDGIDLCHST